MLEENPHKKQVTLRCYKVNARRERVKQKRNNVNKRKTNETKNDKKPKTKK